MSNLQALRSFYPGTPLACLLDMDVLIVFLELGLLFYYWNSVTKQLYSRIILW